MPAHLTAIINKPNEGVSLKNMVFLYHKYDVVAKYLDISGGFPTIFVTHPIVVP